MDIERCDYTTIREVLKKSDAVIMSFGAIEQHGPGCSVGTDARIPDLVAKAVADELGILRAPVLSYGISTDHLRFPGTIALKASTFALVFRDLFDSLFAHGFRRFFLLNGHFDNAHCLKGELLEIMRKYDNVAVYLKDFWDFDEVREIMKRRFDETGGHGDATDVALMRHLSPSEVVVERLVEEWPQVNAYLSLNLHDRYITRSGVIGSDQRKATAEIGEELFVAIVKCVRADIERLMALELSPS